MKELKLALRYRLFGLCVVQVVLVKNPVSSEIPLTIWMLLAKHRNWYGQPASTSTNFWEVLDVQPVGCTIALITRADLSVWAG